MSKDLTLKSRFGGQWHDRLVLEHAINHIVGNLKSITKAALWIGIARKMELASLDSTESVERLSRELLALGQQRTPQNAAKWDELQEATRIAAVYTVTLANKEARILWRELMKLPPTAFGRERNEMTGQMTEVLPTSTGLGVMLHDMAEQLGFAMPEPPDDDEDEDSEGE